MNIQEFFNSYFVQVLIAIIFISVWPIFKRLLRQIRKIESEDISFEIMQQAGIELPKEGASAE